jgi:glutamate-1-semialdehyde 2,1-aminomutase
MAKTTKPKAPPARYAKSEKLFADAVKLMPGGVSSPVRSFKSVGATPVFIKEGKGARLTDVDNHTYIDYVLSYGPLIAGHCPQPVRAAVAKQIDKGSSYGCSNEYEILLARAIAAAMPNVPMVRFVNSGTEATMSALRLARGATRRDIIVKCAGCYHGHVDALLVEAGSGATTHGHPSSPGIPEGITHNTALVPFNDLDAAARIFEKVGDKIAAFVLEPICGNIGVVPPLPGYLEGLRDLCDKYGTLLVFDEVMTGFRVALGGAQGLYGIRPDLTCLGKIIGGGLPVGAYGGRPELMNQVSPAGPVYQAGTLSGNPLSMAAGIATLSLLDDAAAATTGAPSPYTQLESLSARLEEGLKEAAAAAGVPIALQRVGSMLTPFFLSQAQAASAAAADSSVALGSTAPTPGVPVIKNYADALQCDTQAYARFFRAMLDRGIMLPPSQFEAWFVSTAHTEADIDETIAAAREAFEPARGGAGGGDGPPPTAETGLAS